MAMNLPDPTAQTLEFTAAVDPTEETSSIFVSGLYEIVGFWIPTLAANTAILRLQASNDAPGVVIDTSATFLDVVDKAYAVTDITATGTEMADGATVVRLTPEEFIIGPIRIRLAPFQSDGSTGVNQDAQVIEPIWRRM
jgi:hypothetical protein